MIDIAKLDEQVKQLFVEVYPYTSTGSWTNEDLEDQLALRELVSRISTVGNMLRSDFDKTVWAGHETGVVSTEVKSVRAKSDFKNGTPGRKAVSPLEKLAKAMR